MQGRFLAIAGFGNLPGDVALYDRKPDGKFKPMGSVRCGLHATSARSLASLGPLRMRACVCAAATSVTKRRAVAWRARRASQRQASVRRLPAGGAGWRTA